MKPTSTPSKAASSSDAPKGTGKGGSALAAPQVGVDSWAITQAKKAKALKAEAAPTGGRNRFGLMNGVVENKASAKIDAKGHFDTQSFEMSCAINAKTFTKGAIKHEHVGVAGKVTKDDYMLDHSLTSTKVNGAATLLAPKPSQHVGVAPKLPANEYLVQTTKDQQQAIKEAEVFQQLPVPRLESESYFSEHYRKAAALALEAHKQELPRNKGGVYPPADPNASAEEGFLTPQQKVDDSAITPVKTMLTDVIKDPYYLELFQPESGLPSVQEELRPPPKLVGLW